MAVDAYAGQAALWSVDPATGEKAALVVDHGGLDLDRLCARARSLPDARLELRFVAGAYLVRVEPPAATNWRAGLGWLALLAAVTLAAANLRALLARR